MRAVLALSPYDQPYLAHHTLGGLAVPVMYQTGTLDFGIGPSVTRVAGGYDAWRNAALAYLTRLSEEERRAILGGTAVNFYRLS